MKYEEYKEIYNALRHPEDVQRLSSKYDERMLDSLYTQKTTREVKKSFYIVKNSAPKLLREWKSGKSIMDIAKKRSFPPLLTAMILFMEDGASRKEFWSFVRNPDLLDSPETAEELRAATANDIVYSPDANKRQKERGIWGEDLLHQWLDGQEITYRTENDLRGDDEMTKTPDCLLDHPVLFEGHEIHWVESKASFGDNTEFRYNSRKQLIPYTTLFGPGLVVYWVGCLDDLECPPDIYVSDMSVMDKLLEKMDDTRIRKINNTGIRKIDNTGLRDNLSNTV